MVQPLPTAIVPGAGGLIDAYRTGHEDYLNTQKQELMKRAGGLAASGNMTGARSELYKGGDFATAGSISQELRAAATHARTMDNDKLERALKGQGLLGRLAESITTPEQLDAAKARLKGMGLNVDSVTFDQLPSLRQQSLSVQEQLQNELTNRKLDLLKQKADAKANSPAKLTEGQRKAASYVSVMKDANTSLIGDKSKGIKGVMKDDADESPMGVFSSYVSEHATDEVAAKYRSKEQNQFIQAAEQWVIAKLRHQSGATISPAEIRKEMRTFFPISGDDRQTRENKARASKAVEDAISLEATGPVTTPDSPNAPNQPAALPGDPSGLSDDDLMKLLE